MDYLEMYAGLLLAVVCGRIYYRIGEDEYETGAVTAALSMLLSTMAILLFHGGARLVAGMQGGLYVALLVYNLATNHRTPPKKPKAPKVKLTKAQKKAKAEADKKAKAEKKAADKAAKAAAKAAKG